MVICTVYPKLAHDERIAGHRYERCTVKVAYITMRFPVPTEAFAGTDIRVLRDQGVSVSVHTLRAPQVRPAPLLAERRLSGIAITQGTFAGDLRGLAACLGRPALLARLLMWLLCLTWKQPAQLVASLALVPRSMGILSELEREPPDVVHLFWGHYPSIVGYLTLTALPQSVVSVFLGAYDLTQRYGGTAWVARRAALVSTHARWNFPLIEALGVPRERIHLAYRGIDPTLFDGRRGSKTKWRIVSAGRLHEDKGMRDVLLVFRQILGRWPDATLRILGEGEELARLEQLSRSLGIDRAVRFLGHVSREDIASELSAAEVFLHMSLEERLPNVVKEAMASRCVCVVTETQGIDELVVDGRHGFVVQMRDVEAAAARIGDVFSGRVDVTALLDAASQHIVRHFDVMDSMRSYRQRWTDAIATGWKRRQPPGESAPLPVCEEADRPSEAQTEGGSKFVIGGDAVRPQ
jgi:colanic acid/amylovoran biosynthesis glycosyltransferase